MEKTKYDIKKKHFEWQAYLFMVIGCIFYGFSTSVFLAHPGNGFKIVAGGVSGLSVLLNQVFGNIGINISVGVLIAIINIPIFLLGLKQNGWKFILRSLLTVVVLSLATDAIALLFANHPIVEDGDALLASVYGGLAQGVGIGCFIKWKVSSGGTELLGRSIQRFVPFVSIATWVAILDAIIVVVGSVELGVYNVLCALIVIFLSAKVSDIIVLGVNKAKLCYIITNKAEEISTVLLKESPRGITLIKGVGMYTHNEREVLLTCVKTRQLHHLKLIVKALDENAFVIVGEASEVHGKGFAKIDE